jgi:hypothetical protein
MTLQNAFTAAWKDLTSGAAQVAAFLTKNSAEIQTVVTVGGTMVATLDPPLAPVVTEFDLLEELVLGKVLELANDAASANSLGTLFGSIWPIILSMKQQLANHPAVQAATTAPKA